MGKRIISFSLWGQQDIYNRGAIGNVAEAKIIYPGWTCRFYIDARSPVLSTLREMGAEIFAMKPEPNWNALFWRINAISDPTIEYCLLRDCDSRVNSREAVAVADWIKSGKAAHLMKDWPAPHKTETILAGMWGIRGGVIKDAPQLIKNWIAKDDMCNKYTDQDFLRKIIWPRIKHNALNHGVDSPAGVAIPFPQHSPMRFGSYVGQPIDPCAKPG